MKSASTAVCAPQRNTNAAVGRVHRRDSSEVQLYLSKLRRLLPAKPGARRLSKLEVIQSVIDYICDLQYCLQMPQEAADASSRAATFPVTATATSGERTATAFDSCEPMLHDDEYSHPYTTPADVEDEELEDEEEEEELEEDDDDASPASASSRAPLVAQDSGLPVPC